MKIYARLFLFRVVKRWITKWRAIYRQCHCECYCGYRCRRHPEYVDFYVRQNP